jgi:predicted transcriptional regulator
MTRATLAKQIAILEGGKSQARIADIRQILKLLCELEASYRVKQAIEDGIDTGDVGVEQVMQCLLDDCEKMAEKALAKMMKKEAK